MHFAKVIGTVVAARKELNLESRRLLVVRRLNESLDDKERLRLIEMMWTVAYADGTVQEFEENIIWRVSELLGVPARERIAMRRKVREEHGCDPDAPGPWDLDASALQGARP